MSEAGYALFRRDVGRDEVRWSAGATRFASVQALEAWPDAPIPVSAQWSRAVEDAEGSTRWRDGLLRIGAGKSARAGDAGPPTAGRPQFPDDGLAVAHALNARAVRLLAAPLAGPGNPAGSCLAIPALAGDGPALHLVRAAAGAGLDALLDARLVALAADALRHQSGLRLLLPVSAASLVSADWRDAAAIAAPVAGRLALLVGDDGRVAADALGDGLAAIDRLGIGLVLGDVGFADRPLAWLRSVPLRGVALAEELLFGVADDPARPALLTRLGEALAPLPIWAPCGDDVAAALIARAGLRPLRPLSPARQDREPDPARISRPDVRREA